MLASFMFFLRAGPGKGPNVGWSRTDMVTINKTRYDVEGRRKVRSFDVTGNSGNTLYTGLTKIENVFWSSDAITSIQYTDHGSITFNASGAFTNAKVTVTGN